jgi:nitrite reductase (NADH) small subunit
VEQNETVKEHNLGPAAQIPAGEGREFVVEGLRIAVFRPRSGGIYATQAACTHREGPLADGLVGGTTVICPYHAWKFDLTTGLPLLGEGCLTTYPVHVTETGDIRLTVAEGAAHEVRECTACSSSTRRNGTAWRSATGPPCSAS